MAGGGGEPGRGAPAALDLVRGARGDKDAAARLARRYGSESDAQGLPGVAEGRRSECYEASRVLLPVGLLNRLCAALRGDAMDAPAAGLDEGCRDLEALIHSHQANLFDPAGRIYGASTQRMRWLDPDHDKFCRHSSATAVNDRGDVVGWVETYDRERTVAMIWTYAGGSQTLSDSLAPNRAAIWATDINNARQVVGGLLLANQGWRQSLFYWDKDNGLSDLKKLLDPADPMSAEVILHASAVSGVESPYIPKINDRGEILVSGSLRGDKDIFLRPRRAFLLVPVQKQQ